MQIIAYKPGHDGTVAYIKEGQLVFSIEAEKDSQVRHAAVGPDHFIDTLSYLDSPPDVIAMSGWSKGRTIYNQPIAAGYQGITTESLIAKEMSFLGRKTQFFSSSHERSHILCAFGLSDFPKGQPCYALIWEGALGTFYELDEQLNITCLGSALNEPGNRFAFLYGLADPSFSSKTTYVNLSFAGKLMALASFSNRKEMTKEEEELCDILLTKTPYVKPKLKDDLKQFSYYNVGLEDSEFRNFSGIFSDKIFDIFYQFAKIHCTKKLPLLIAGGCGLNCDWNTQWRNTNLFSDVFVPPVANDSGSAIGTAIDAQFYYTKNPKLTWNVYAGLDFDYDIQVDAAIFDSFDLSYSTVAELLADELVIAWVQDKYEIGPRALGNRSLLAAPFKSEMTTRLNVIKEREQFRPIAPICLEEDAKKFFDCQIASPFMLYFYYVNTPALAAITHVNNTARIQTISEVSNPKMFQLLTAFRESTGYGVLCNTSLNFKGTGFINKMSDLITYVVEHNIDGCVVGNRCYLVKNSIRYQNFVANSINKKSKVNV